jgi:predicted TIM-barrel fold metal-dependent hydrolase
MRRYELISCDGHVNEPPDLFTARVPAKFKDRAPHIQRFEEFGGDAWIIEGAADPINFGMNAVAGLPKEQYNSWKKFEDLRPGGWDGKARCAEMDEDGVDAEVMYPTPRLGQGVAATEDPEFHLALVQAYNDWLSEYVSADPERFAGQMMIPNRGVDQAVAEIKRVAGRPGMFGALLTCYPNGTLEPKPEDDAVWEVLVDMDWPLSIHVSLSNTMPQAHRAKLPGFSRFMSVPNTLVDMIYSGMFDRFPDLNVVVAEVEVGWVPFLKEQIDGNYQRMVYHTDIKLPHLPSHYIEKHVSFGYITDPFGLSVRDRIGVEHILWSSDYPHQAADWPFSWKTIQASMSGIPKEERELILAGNAMRLYHFGE